MSFGVTAGVVHVTTKSTGWFLSRASTESYSGTGRALGCRVTTPTQSIPGSPAATSQ